MPLRSLSRDLRWASVAVLFAACGDDGLTSVGPDLTQIPLRLASQVSLPDLSTPASIDEARIVGDALRLRVSYSGGCTRHDFGVTGQRVLLESDPPQVVVVLRHDGHGDPCRANVTSDLGVDLRPLRSLLSGGGTLGLRLYQPQSSTPIGAALLYVF
jgi:hypothetical protein